MIEYLPCIFFWWLAIAAVGWLVFPLTFRCAMLLPDRGLGIAKLSGLTLVTLGAAWLRFTGTSVGNGYSLMPVCLTVAGLAVLNLLLLRRYGNALRTFFREGGWRIALSYEAVFAVAYLLFLWFRSHFPDATFDVQWYGAEKWVNLTTLTGQWRNGGIPPMDPWLSGHSMNYYYFSHLIWAMLARVSGTVPEVAFNLGLGTTSALLITMAFSTGWALTERKRGALIAVFLIAFAGPILTWIQLPSLLHVFKTNGLNYALQFFSFWTPSDAIPSTRNEFPAFNWLLGDLHAHATGFLLILLALCLLAHLQRVREMEASTWRGLAWSQVWTCALLTLTLAAMWMTNSWDLMVVGLLGAAWIGTESFRKFTWREFISEEIQGLALWAIAGGLAIKVFAVFFSRNIAMPLDFSHNAMLADLPSPFSALGAVGLVGKDMTTTITQWFSFWGLFVIPLLILLLGRAFKNSVRDWANSPGLALGACGVLVALLLAHAFPNLSRVGLLLLVVLLLSKCYVMRALSRGTLQPATQWAWILGLTALAFIIIPEFFYLDDPIGSMDSPEGLALQRYNTVFKLYYPAWGLMALAVAIACRNVFQNEISESRDFNIKTRRFSFLPSMPLLALLWLVIAGGLYPVLGVANRLVTSQERAAKWAATQPEGTSPRFFYGTLNGLGFMRLPQYNASDDLELALWMRDNLKGSGVLAEASGASYCITARFSAITGIPCVLGWESHEAQWRGEFFSQEVYPKRIAALKRLYESADLAEKREACRELGVKWVVLGALERERYAGPGVEKVSELGKTLKQVGAAMVVEVDENK